MEEITEQEARDLIKQEKERVNQILESGGKFIKIVIEEKDKTTIISKLKPVDKKPTGMRIIQTRDNIILQKL